MRLTPEQRQAMVETFAATFGTGVLMLFGSRVDDHQRGGDIDLYVIADGARSPDVVSRQRLAFLAQLKRRIGEQKIDLVLAAEPPRPIDHIARTQGIILCEKH